MLCTLPLCHWPNVWPATKWSRTTLFSGAKTNANYRLFLRRTWTEVTQAVRWQHARPQVSLMSKPLGPARKSVSLRNHRWQQLCIYLPHHILQHPAGHAYVSLPDTGQQQACSAHQLNACQQGFCHIELLSSGIIISQLRACWAHTVVTANRAPSTTAIWLTDTTTVASIGPLPVFASCLGPAIKQIMPAPSYL